MNRLIEAFEALRARTDLAILALRRGDKTAAIQEVDSAVESLRTALEQTDAEGHDLPAEDQSRRDSLRERHDGSDLEGA